MNKKLITAIVIAGVTLISHPSQALLHYLNDYSETLNTAHMPSTDLVDWVQFAPGNAGDSDGVFIHPTNDDIMFSFPDMGNAYRSADGGKTWTTLLDSDQTTSRPLTMVYGMDFSRQNPNFGMAANSSGIQITTDAGVTFGDFILSANIETITVHPHNDNIWFAGTGNFWNTKQNYRTYVSPHGIKPAPNAGKLYKTVDAGQTWTELKNTGIHPKAEFGVFYIYPSDPNLMFTATTYGLYKSTDGGNSWNKIESIELADGDDHDLVMDLEVYEDPQTGKLTLYVINQIKYDIDTEAGMVTSSGGILKSHDLGNTWIDISGDLGVDFTQIHDATYDLVQNTLKPNGIDYIGHENFVKNWFPTATSKYFNKSKYRPNNASVTAIAPNLPTHFLHNFDQIEVDPTNPDKIYISQDGKWSASTLIGDVWTTDNGGEDWYIATRTGLAWDYPNEYWESLNQPMGKNVQPDHYNYDYGIELYTTQGMRDLDMNSKGEVFALYRTLYKSTDGGEYWQNLDSVQLPSGGWTGTGASNLPGKQIITDTRDPNLMYMVGGENRLFQKVNDDEEYYYPDTASMLNYPDSPENISMIAIHPEDLNTMYSLMLRQGGQGDIYKSTDAGVTWKSMANIFKTPDVHTKVVQKGFIIDPTNPDNMYFSVTATNVNEVPPLHGTQYSGVYKSTDGGYTWNKNTAGLPGTHDVFDLEFAPNDTTTIYAASSAGKDIPIPKLETASEWTLDQGASFYTFYAGKGHYSLALPATATAQRALPTLAPNTEYYISTLVTTDPDGESIMSIVAEDGTVLGQETLVSSNFEIKGIFFTTPDNPNVSLTFEGTGEGDVYPDKITLKTAGGLYRSTDSGETFARVESFPQIPQVNDITVAGDKIYVAGGNATTGIANGGLWVGDGETWTKIFEHPKTLAIDVDPYNHDRLLIFTARESYNYYDEDSYNAGVYYSDDAGATWSKINHGLGNPTGVYDVAFDLADPNVLWLTSSSGGFYKGFIGGAPERETNLPEYTVTFATGADTQTQTVEKYSKAIKIGPTNIVWHLNGAPYNFNTPVIADITLEAIPK